MRTPWLRSTIDHQKYSVNIIAPSEQNYNVQRRCTGIQESREVQGVQRVKGNCVLLFSPSYVPRYSRAQSMCSETDYAVARTARMPPSSTPPPSTDVRPRSNTVAATGGATTMPARRWRARSRREVLYEALSAGAEETGIAVGWGAAGATAGSTAVAAEGRVQGTLSVAAPKAGAAGASTAGAEDGTGVGEVTMISGLPARSGASSASSSFGHADASDTLVAADAAERGSEKSDEALALDVAEDADVTDETEIADEHELERVCPCPCARGAGAGSVSVCTVSPRSIRERAARCNVARSAARVSAGGGAGMLATTGVTGGDATARRGSAGAAEDVGDAGAGACQTTRALVERANLTRTEPGSTKRSSSSPPSPRAAAQPAQSTPEAAHAACNGRGGVPIGVSVRQRRPDPRAGVAGSHDGV
jgi:hypothetical protein